MEPVINAFSTCLLPLEDGFLYVGFIVPVFILWVTKKGDPRLSLFMIGILSTASVVVAQLYMIINTLLGFISKIIMQEIYH